MSVACCAEEVAQKRFCGRGIAEEFMRKRTLRKRTSRKLLCGRWLCGKALLASSEKCALLILQCICCRELC
eukprot:13033178-Alexandrium_andersonii.AAC.1